MKISVLRFFCPGTLGRGTKAVFREEQAKKRREKNEEKMRVHYPINNEAIIE